MKSKQKQSEKEKETECVLVVCCTFGSLFSGAFFLFGANIIFIIFIELNSMGSRLKSKI